MAFCLLTISGRNLVLGQESQMQEVRFDRVHLHNGNFIDGNVVRQTEQEVVLRIKFGEMGIRNDQVVRVEQVRMRSIREKPQPSAAPSAPKRPVQTADPFAGQAAAPRVPDTLPAPKLASKARLPSQLFEPAGELRQKVDPLLHALESADVEQKAQVVQQLVGTGGEAAPYLASLLESVDRDTFPHVVDALMLLKESRAVPVLIRQLESGRAPVRARAAAILAATGDVGAAPLLLPLLKDEEAEVRSAGLASLRVLGGPLLLEHLPVVCADPDREVRTMAIGTYFDLSRKHGAEWNVAAGLAGALERSRGAASIDLISAIANSGKGEAWSILIPYLLSERVDVRAAAAAGLGNLGGVESSAAILARLAQEQDKRVRIELARAVRRLVLLRATGPLIEWVGDPDIEVRTAALQALTTITGKSFGPDREKWSAWWEQSKPPGE